MNKKNIYILAPNIKNGGGKELLEYLIEYITNIDSIDLTVYLDVSLKHIQSKENMKVIHFSSSLAKIKLFNQKFTNAIYFGNLPPLIKAINSMVYFHNPYLLMDSKELQKTSFKFFLKYSLQQLYIKFFIKNVDFVACQNKTIKESFIKMYNFSNIKILPFFRQCKKENSSKNSKLYDFCYVSLAHPHKNHIKLLNAMEILSNKNIKTTLALTIEEGHSDLIEMIDIINKKGIVQITNLGLLPKEEVCKLYTQSKALVFPSTQETFGLALIEAVDIGLDVIASDLDYVYEALEPTLVFDENSSVDIANKVIEYLEKGRYNQQSRAIINNQIEDMINLILEKESNV